MSRLTIRMYSYVTSYNHDRMYSYVTSYNHDRMYSYVTSYNHERMYSHVLPDIKLCFVSVYKVYSHVMLGTYLVVKYPANKQTKSSILSL